MQRNTVFRNVFLKEKKKIAICNAFEEIICENGQLPSFLFSSLKTRVKYTQKMSSSISHLLIL